MKKILVFVLLFFATSSAWCYDTILANSYEQYFMQFAGKSTQGESTLITQCYMKQLLTH
jgi:hypothetical protein